MPVSIGNDFEYSGAIVLNHDRKTFSFTDLVTLNDATGSNFNPRTPLGRKLVALYHTPGATKNNAENFSFEGILICRHKKILSRLSRTKLMLG